MRPGSDVNPVYEKWKSSTGAEKEWALESLIEKMKRYATAICYKKLPDHQESFDSLTGEIVWKAVKKLDSFEGKAKFSTWFWYIATNECNRFLKQLKRQRREIALEEQGPEPLQLVNIDAQVDLMGMLDKLAGDDHLLFRLVAEGWDFKTIGEQLGITRNAALVRWTRLKGRLRDAI